MIRRQGADVHIETYLHIDVVPRYQELWIPRTLYIYVLLDLYNIEKCICQEQHRENKSKRADINTTISKITLIVKGLNNPIRWQRLSYWIKNKDLGHRGGSVG